MEDNLYDLAIVPGSINGVLIDSDEFENPHAVSADEIVAYLNRKQRERTYFINKDGSIGYRLNPISKPRIVIGESKDGKQGC